MDADMVDESADGAEDVADIEIDLDQHGEALVVEVDLDEERASEVDDLTEGLARPASDDQPSDDPVVAELTAERDSWKDTALRLQADFDNYRRRMTAQQSDEVDRATGRLAEALLPVLDAAEAAFVQHPAEVEPLLNVLLGELRKQGLEVMKLQDQPFDPSLADAVMHEPGDGGEGGEPTVADVLRTGYTWKSKVLRAAMVKVKG